MAQDLAISAPLAGHPSGRVVAHRAVVLADGPGALARIAVLVDPAGARERGATLSAIVAWGVGNETGAIATVLAPVVEEILAAVALGAVLAMLAGTVFADLAVGNCGVVLGGALATVIDVHADDSAVLALKGGYAAALEVPHAEHGHAGRTCLDAYTVEQVPAVAAL